MSKKAAILGLGDRGRAWAEAFRQAGWHVSCFDPDPAASGQKPETRGWRREETISKTVALADWVVCCLPDRLELMQKVIQRAEAQAQENTVFAVSSRQYDVEVIQNCAIRPARVVMLSESPEADVELIVSPRNAPELKVDALAVLSEVRPFVSQTKEEPTGSSQSDEAKSA